MSKKSFDYLGWSQSYWLPMRWTAKDRAGEPLQLHRWICESTRVALQARGYAADIMPAIGTYSNDSTAVSAARDSGADRIIILRLKRLGSFTGGYLVIPLVSIMSARLELDFAIFDASGTKLQDQHFTEKHVSAKGWKVLLFDSVFDVFWGKRWYQKEFAERLVPELIDKIQAELEGSWSSGMQPSGAAP